MFVTRLLKAVLRTSLIVLGSAVFLCGAPACADEAHPPMIVGPSSDFITYAAFAKLESNIAEATLNVFLLSKAEGDERKAIVANFDNDVEAIRIYTGQLEGMKLSGDGATALNAFKTDWTTFERDARAAIQKGGNVTRKELYALYAMANKMDDHIDETLKMLRTQMEKAAS